MADICNCRTATMGSTHCEKCGHDLGCPVHNGVHCLRAPEPGEAAKGEKMDVTVDWFRLAGEATDRADALQRRVEEWQKQANQADALRMGLHDRITALEAALAEAEEKLTEARRLAWQHGAEAIMAHIGFDEGKRDKLHRKNPYRDQRAPNVWCAPAGAKAPALEGVDLAQLADGRREGGPLNTERGRGDRPSESMSEPAAEIRGNVVASPTRSARAEARSDGEGRYDSPGVLTHQLEPGQAAQWQSEAAQPHQPALFGPTEALRAEIAFAAREAERRGGSICEVMHAFADLMDRKI